jgi:hypothetical protein
MISTNFHGINLAANEEDLQKLEQMFASGIIATTPEESSSTALTKDYVEKASIDNTPPQEYSILGKNGFLYSVTPKDAKTIREKTNFYIKLGHQGEIGDSFSSMTKWKDDNKELFSSAFKIVTIIHQFRGSDRDSDTIYSVQQNHEWESIQLLIDALPETIVNFLTNALEAMSFNSLVPIHNEEHDEKIDKSSESYVAYLTSPEVWEHLRYVWFDMTGTELDSVDDNIGKVLNLISRHDESINSLQEAVYNLFKALQSVSL